MPPTRTACYVRYSSDHQRAASIADQLALLTRLAEARGLPAPAVYEDAAISGTHTHRPGLQRLLADAAEGQVDVLLIEDLSRLARDLGDTDRLVKRLAFDGVRILAADGFDSANEFAGMQVGLRGIMDEHYIRDLARRTHRGQTGAIARGHHAGGRAYGYRSVPVPGPGGTPQGFARVIDAEQAAIVRRIFERFASGATVWDIVRELNRDHIPGPRGTTWSRSALYPDPKRPGVGILGNPLYRGEVVWNRTRWVKAPGAATRTAIPRPPEEWQVQQHPELVIVPPDLWAAAAAQIQRHAHRPGRRGTGLLTGILRCATCGAAYVAINQTRLGCSAHKERGPDVCAQALTLLRTRTERVLLDYVRQDLVSPEALAYFTAELLRAQAEHQPDTSAIKTRIQEADTRARNILRAIEAGIFTESTAAALRQAEADRTAAQRELEQAHRPPVAPIDPRIIHRRVVAQLDAIEDKPAARQALGEILGRVEIVALPTGPVARIDQGRALAALVENSGSGGALQLFSTLIELDLSS
jgi:DNA invertase Pin-like site-specific DNA recombinase